MFNRKAGSQNQFKPNLYSQASTTSTPDGNSQILPVPKVPEPDCISANSTSPPDCAKTSASNHLARTLSELTLNDFQSRSGSQAFHFHFAIQNTQGKAVTHPGSVVGTSIDRCVLSDSPSYLLRYFSKLRHLSSSPPSSSPSS